MITSQRRFNGEAPGRWAWLALAAAPLVLVGCGATVGSGDVATLEPDVDAFTSLEVSSAFDVAVRSGEGYSLVVRVDDNVVDQVRASVSGDTLTIAMDGSVSDVILEADVTVPDGSLTQVKASGASTVLADVALSGSAANVDATGASTIDVGAETTSLDVKAEGASTITVSGSAAELEVNAEGASSVDLVELSAGNASADAEGASTIELTVSGSLEAEASGASTIRYFGSPAQVSEDDSGSSTIEPG